MKLTDKKNFEITCGGAIEYGFKDYLDLEECLNLKILGNIQEEKGNKAMIELENGKKFFINARNDIAAQCLKKVIIIIQRDYKGKSLNDLINREFCSAEKIG